MIYKKTFVFIFLSILFSCTDDNLAEKEVSYLQKTKEYLLSQHYKTAEIEIKNAIKTNPKNPESRWLHAKALFGLSNYQHAIEEVKFAVSLCQNGDKKLAISSCGISTDASQVLSKSLYYIGSFDEVIAFNAYDNIPETNAAVYAVKALASIKKGELIKSNEYLQQSLGFAPNSILVRVAQAQYLFVTDDEESLKAKAILHQVLTEEPTNKLAWQVLGDFEYYQGQIEEAIKAYSKLIELNPLFLSSRFNRALGFIKLNRFEEAQNDVTFLLKSNSSDPRANFAQGLIYFNEKKYQLALSAFELSRSINKHYPIINFYLSLVNTQLGYEEQAYKHANNFYRNNPSNISAVKLFALVHLNDGLFEEAENLLSTEVNDASKDVGLLTLLFDSLVKQGKTDEASLISLKLQKAQPDNSKTQLKLGAGFFSKGDTDKGISLLEQSLIVTPTNYQIIKVLVDSYLQKGEVEKALNLVKTSNLSELNQAGEHYLNGRISLEKGDVSTAQQQFATAAKLKQGNPEFNHQLAQLSIVSKDYISARKYLVTVLEYNKNHLATLLKIAALDTLEKNESAMLSTLKFAISAHPKAIEPKLILSRYYLAKGEAGKSLNQLNFLEKSDRERADVLLEIGLAEIAEQNYLGAKYTLEKLIQKSDGVPAHYLSLAKAHIGLEQYPRALELLDQALVLDTYFLPARLKKTQLLIHNKNRKQAEKEISFLQAHLAGDSRLLSLEAALANLVGDLSKVLIISEQLYQIVPSQENMLRLVRARVQKDKKDMAISLLLNWLEDHSSDTLSRKVLAELYHRMGQEDKAEEQYKLIYG